MMQVEYSLTITIVPLRKENFSDFLNVLNSRAYAPEMFYQWKYLEYRKEVSIPRGFLAYTNNECVGVVGIVPRSWKSKGGICYSATWAADLYVIPNARGKNIGEILFQQVKSLCPISIFIPGTPAVRHLTEKIGYTPLNSVEEVTYVLRPYHFGWKNGGGSVIRRIIRSLRYTINTWRSNLFSADTLELQIGKPDNNLWSNFSESYFVNVPHLERTDSFLNWLTEMPSIKGTSQKNWWHWNDQTYGIVGVLDEDRWGAKRCRIFDYWGAGIEYDGSIWKSLLASLIKINVDYVVCYGAPSIARPLPTCRKRIPLFAVGISNTTVRGIDRESWYFDVR